MFGLWLIFGYYIYLEVVIKHFQTYIRDEFKDQSHGIRPLGGYPPLPPPA